MKVSGLRKYICIVIAIAALCLPSAVKAEAEEALDMTLAQNLQTPEVPKRAEQYVRIHMDQMRRNLAKNGLEGKLLREGEVIRITVPCGDLFGINSVELKPGAAEVLRKFGIVVNDPLKYKLLVAVHTDDTGDEQYADSISAARANAIDDGLWQIAGEKETNVIPYGIGKDDPLVKNNSMANRAQNRRVEFFIVPENGLIEMAGVKTKK